MNESQRWFLLITLVIAGGLIYLLSPILSPFLVGALLAYLTDPVADRLEAKGFNRTQSVVTVFVIMTLVLALAVLLLLPQLTEQIQTMVRQIPVVAEVLHSRLLPWIEQNTGLSISRPDLDSMRQLFAQYWQETGNVAAKLMGGITRSGVALAGWIANLVLIPVVTFYLLRDWDVMMANIQHLLPRNLEPKVTLWARECDEVLGAFVKGQLLVMLALGIVYAVGLWIVGLDLALLIGMLAGLASIVPYMGFIIGIVVAAVAAYVQFQDPTILAWVGLVFAIGQMLEGMVLTPLLVGDRIGLHPVAVIFAIMAGGQLFGFVGILLALPVAAVIMVLLRHLHDGYKKSRLYSTDEPEQAGEVE
ncbi:putative permease often clustered with de novo purine synthesis [Marinobacterium lacunae]|uniref:Putative permease often clustered with de novo purine synthesis n=1 Tax=Marinobacterium lacunae TaxID=1232683 RepID=A0A081FW26_9GAMM|nr:AI-2E family transporter [Marinobacterium lacunae]KEA62731.1 putative permease often clustered with de novo purine synthesis [Marinobacterium lacunae]